MMSAADVGQSTLNAIREQVKKIDISDMELLDLLVMTVHRFTVQR